ncbi:helix-turn-helix domain-containing protein [Bradyrhizobium stylosanthis]|uniref:Transcriptional regulator n=1 Tax=Bradyrhizobium stylosanthis TaxID=1803665 RepID=A0A560CXI7_9BRAD|nr:helix-turn-helix domain-containing protein [Bradyrhizobium stylosanthis]TWA89551.1 transcriptional regulator [Bradyrhizobium stylosanthis]
MQEIDRTPVFIERRPSIPFAAIGGRIGRTNPTAGEGCPCCGAAMNRPKAFVDFNSHHLILGNKTVALSPFEARLADILVRRAPGAVTYDAIIMHAWDEEPEDALAALKTHIVHLKRKAALLGIKIVNVHSVGYRVVI